MRKAGPVRASACLFAGWLAVCCPILAVAASPRDAIQNLPTLTYTNQYIITDPGTAGQPYTDGLYTALDISWSPPGIPLKGGVNLKTFANTHIKMSDLLNRTSRSSSDSRFEAFDFTLRVDKPGTFNSAYTFSRGDTWTGGTNTGGVASLQSGNSKTFNFSLNMPGYPVLDVGSSVTDSYQPSAPFVETGSSVETSGYGLTYEKDAGAIYSRYEMDMQSNQFTTFGAGTRSDRSRTTTAFDAVRRMPLGQAGNLQLSYHYDEDSSSSLSRPQAEVTRTSRYQLNLDGKVANFPLDYSAWFTNFNQSPSNNNTQNSVDRLLTLTFRPPVPKGKSATLRLTQQLTDTEDANSNISIQRQTAVWDYVPNPRTRGSIAYSNYSATDLRDKERTQEDENVNLTLNYTIPGERGNISTNYLSGVQRQSGQGSRVTSSQFGLNNYFRLGDLADMTLFYNQSYSDNSSELQIPASNDTVYAGFTYNLDSRQGYHLYATWRNNLLRQNPSGSKTNDQSVNVVVTWQPQQNWRYQLSINSNDSNHQDEFIGLNPVYRSNDTINATVTYTF